MQLSIVMAMTKNGGIGLKGVLPWHSKEELKHFNKITQDSIILVGKKTFKSIQELKNRLLICVSSTDPSFYSMEQAVEMISSTHLSDKVFIGGGKEIFEKALLKKDVQRIYCSVMNNDFKCDVFIDPALVFENSLFKISSQKKHKDFTLYILDAIPIAQQE